jgi:hypothetical protein
MVLDGVLSVLQGLGVVIPTLLTLLCESRLERWGDGGLGLAGAFARVGVKGSPTGRRDKLCVGFQPHHVEVVGERRGRQVGYWYRSNHIPITIPWYILHNRRVISL